MPIFQNGITSLGVTASFRDWFNQYNDSVLGKLNNALISRPLAGDGITFSYQSDGGYTFEISNKITKAITFSGNVAFEGSVSLGSSRLSGLAVEITGNYISRGVTAGKVVRLTSTGGLTLAKADTPSNAEVLGIAIDVNATRTIVAVAGKVSGSTLASNLITGGLTSGCVYFVDPVIAGGITRTEPTTVGLVSKPILVGMGTIEGNILPYRGQYIQGSCGASGSYLFNSSVLIEVESKGEAETSFEMRPGALIAVDIEKPSYSTAYTSISGTPLYFKATSLTPVEKIIGIVSEYVGAYDSTVGAKITLKVNTSGSVINNISSLDGWGSLDSGVVYLEPTGTFTQKKPTTDVIVVGNVSGNNLVLNIDSPSQIFTTISGAGGTRFQNYLINGSLNLWQRGLGVSAAYGITASTTPNKKYIADRWIMWGASGERGFTGERKSFSPKTQTDVLGYPNYYISLIKNTTDSSLVSNFYNVIEDPRTIANKQLTFSFYARTIGGTGSFTINSTQYTSTSGYINGITHATHTSAIASNWSRYSATFVGPTASSAAVSYFLMGIGLRNNGRTYEFAQFILEDGSTASTPTMVSFAEDYSRAAEFYQRSYGPDEKTGTDTIETNRGNLGILSPNSVILSHTMKYRMTRTPEVTIYSLKGNTGEISFKDTASPTDTLWYDSKDNTLFATRIKNCAIAFGAAPVQRWNGNNFSVNPISNVRKTQADFNFVPYTSYCWFDFVGFHYVADADTTIY
jgi:hypothetical protein